MYKRGKDALKNKKKLLRIKYYSN